MKIAYLTQEFDVEPTRTVRVSVLIYAALVLRAVLHQPDVCGH